MKTTKMTATKEKTDQELKPGDLRAATIERLGNGAYTVQWDHVPDPPKKGADYPFFKERLRDGFSSVEEACHAIAQKWGGSSEIDDEAYDKKEDAADAKKGKAA